MSDYQKLLQQVEGLKKRIKEQENAIDELRALLEQILSTSSFARSKYYQIVRDNNLVNLR